MYKVGVLIAVHNEEAHIKQCLDSILAQNFDAEIVVVDDFSTDNTMTVLEEYAGIDGVSIYKNKSRGKVHAYNLAFSKSQSRTVCLLGGDDWLPEDSLSKRYSMLESWNFQGIVYGKTVTTSDDKNFDDVKIPRFGTGGHHCGGTFLISRERASEMFPINTELANEDTWIKTFVSIFDVPILDLNAVVLRYRIHPGNSNNRYLPFEKYSEVIAARFSCYETFLKTYRDKLTEKQRQWLEERIIGERLRRAGKWWQIILCRLPLRMKLTFIFNSNRLFYGAKKLFGYSIPAFIYRNR